MFAFRVRPPRLTAAQGCGNRIEGRARKGHPNVRAGYGVGAPAGNGAAGMRRGAYSGGVGRGSEAGR